MALRTFLVAFFVALLVLTCPSLAQDDTVDYDPRLDPPSSEDRANVLVLTDETFDATVNTHYNVFVKFYAPWCGHCQAMEGEWARLATRVRNEGIDLVVAEVDGTSNPELDHKGGEMAHEFSKDRDVETMLKWVLDRMAGLPEEEEATITAADYDDSHIPLLTHEDFDSFVQSHPEGVLVNFCTPKTPHCHNYYYEFTLLFSELEKEEGAQILAKVDAFEDQLLATRFDIKRYPTILLFRDGDPSMGTEYEGSPYFEGMVEFLKKRRRPLLFAVDSQSEIERFRKIPGPKVYLFDSAPSEDSVRLFRRAASHKDVAHAYFALVKDRSVQEKLSETPQDETIILQPEFEPELVLPLAKATHAKQIVEFVATNDGVLLEPLGEAMWKKAGQEGRPIGIFFVQRDDTEGRRIAHEVAKEFRAQNEKTVWAEAFVDDFAERLGENWGITGTVLPTALLIKFTDEGMVDRTVFNEENPNGLTLETAKEFFESAMRGEYTSYRRSQPIPAENTGPVKIAVLKTWESVVLDESKDVLVEFFAPWCYHCQELAPVLDEVAVEQKENETVALYKYDLTANAAPDGVEIEGLPTVMIFPRGSKSEPLVYNGDRTKEDLHRFIRGEPTNPAPEPQYLTGDDLPPDGAEYDGERNEEVAELLEDHEKELVEQTEGAHEDL